MFLNNKLTPIMKFMSDYDLSVVQNIYVCTYHNDTIYGCNNFLKHFIIHISSNFPSRAKNIYDF